MNYGAGVVEAQPTPGSETTAANVDGQECSIDRALSVIGDRWSILILRDAFRGIRRFGEIQRDLGIARPVLSERLTRLVDAGVLERTRYNEHPPRFDYRLTAMGRELSPILVALMQWGDRHLHDGRPPTVLEHTVCHQPLDARLFCSTCGRRLAAHEIAASEPVSDREADSPSAHESTSEDP